MNPTEMDRALRTDDRIEPSPEFQSRVMRSVHAHARAAACQKQNMLWRALWPTVAIASVVLPVLIAVRAIEVTALEAGNAAEAARWLTFTVAATLAGGWWFTQENVWS